MDRKRRTLLAATGVILLPVMRPVRGQQRMKIGIIGSGRVGGTIGELWVKAGHEVMFSARTLEEVNALLAKLQLGPRARAGTPKEAAAFGEAVLISVPYAALPQVGHDNAAELKDKVVLDTSNPIENRDGPMAVEMRAKGTGIASAELLPGVRLVRAFNCVGWNSMRSEAHRAGEKLAIPLAADDAGALKVAIGLVEDAGFEPVVVGGLSHAREFDVGTPIFGKAVTAKELRSILGLAAR
ncbi:MAG TPA: NADPH-dependent F420 reductase [Burkholderiales bacterium]|nr:NADPH-dependent F420 reductase [Burkholderiales bacterium]